ncbi:hypothetical protein [Ruminococcus sp.]|uniref:hypothetical protein n=1 Tax=Ruminococcus sp. TaxID=41978 RepID=UPI0025E6DD06|nr:hypothetical protein [Ruminococcus sp.]MBQ8966859.1 hypothetical protein [Ruminococcus sp.]
MRKIISLATALVTAAAILNITAQISFCVTVKQRSAAIMMSMGMSFREMRGIYMLNFLKLLLITQVTAAVVSYFTVTYMIYMVMYDLGIMPSSDMGKLVMTIVSVAVLTLLISELIMSVIFSGTFRRRSAAECLKR